MPTGWITSDDKDKCILDMAPFRNCQLKRIWKRATNRQDDHRQYIRQSLKHIFSLEYLLFVFWTVTSYMGHVNFTVTFLEYTETITPDFSSYIDFYGNLTFMSAVIAIFNALLVDGFVRKYSTERALQT